MDRIHHRYEVWEDHKHGFYNNCTGEEKEKKKQLVIEMFSSESETRKMMFRVVNEWKFSCEHNLTNNGLNQIAYIGQSACCLYAQIPSTATMEAWSLLSKDIQDRSDRIAQEAINQWKKQNKNLQLCLSID